MLLTSALDMLEVRKSSKTSSVTCAQPLGPQQAQAGGVPTGSVTLSVLPGTLSQALERNGTSWSLRTMS